MPDAFLTTPPDEARLGEALASTVGNVWLMGLPTAGGGAVCPAVVMSLAGFRGFTQDHDQRDVVLAPLEARLLAESVLAVLDRNGL